jgi:hypothetical protein
VTAPGWPAADWVRVQGGNWITRWMTQLLSGESCGGELEPDPLGLGFAIPVLVMVDLLRGGGSRSVIG